MRKHLDSRFSLYLIEDPSALEAVENLQRIVWPGNDTEVVPLHMLVAVIHNGGLIIGAYDTGEGETGGSLEETKTGEKPPGNLVGFVFGFPGMYETPDGPRLKHCSHMLAVDPKYRDQGIGFALKRAQWQMVRRQGLDRITWTYDPLQSRNAHLNIALLGAVCDTYLREAYGRMRDGLNVGIPSDRFQVDWWVNSKRVLHRLSRQARAPLSLEQYLSAEAPIINTVQFGDDNLPYPPEHIEEHLLLSESVQERPSVLLVEIPANFMELKAAHAEMAIEWRYHTREIFEKLFAKGYLVTDFIHQPGALPRSFYVLVHGESTL